MVLATDGKILYVSETVNDHIGLNWVCHMIVHACPAWCTMYPYSNIIKEELPGSAINDIVPNQEDRTELKSRLRTLNNKEIEGEGKLYYII